MNNRPYAAAFAFLLSSTIAVPDATAYGPAPSPQGSSADSATMEANTEWNRRPRAKAGKRRAQKQNNLRSGSNYGDASPPPYIGETWTDQDAADYLVTEGVTYNDGFHDEFYYVECAATEYTNYFNCYTESTRIRPYFADLWYHSEENTLDVWFVEYAPESDSTDPES